MPREQVSWTPGPALIVVAMILVTLASVPGARAAGKYKTLHTFTGGTDGFHPVADLISDAAGNLYGTTEWGGAYSYGTVFRLSPNGHGGWKESVLYSFNFYKHGYHPYGGVVLDHAGNLYGTTDSGGTRDYGTVFKLSPNGDGTWKQSVLHSFMGGLDGIQPDAGLIVDPAGNLLGTTGQGGIHGVGTVFQLRRKGNGGWVETLIHVFNGMDGYSPLARLTLDPAGNLYGTTSYGGTYKYYGTVFKLTPNGDGSWNESVLHSFNKDGADGIGPLSSLTLDPAGNLYGTTQGGGAYGYGTVFKLTPNKDESWTESVLHSFNASRGTDGGYPFAGLILGPGESLYGTTIGGGAYGVGTVFELKYTLKGGWQEVVLHSFKNRPGALPLATMTFDGYGTLYGTTGGDKLETWGSVFEIVP